jgi:hypothetical protein
VLKIVDEAARCEHCNWDLAKRIREQGALVPLPEVQSLRTIVNLLSLRSRLAMAEGRLDDALRDIETGLMTARRLSESPCLICTLVSGFLANIICVRLQEFVERDQAPNLYWAWTDLPHPFLDLRLPLQGARLMAYASFPGGIQAANDPKATLEPEVSIKQLEYFLDLTGRFHDDLLDRAMSRELAQGIRRLDLGLAILDRHETAKKALIEAGRSREVVEAMKPLHVAILHGLLEHDRLLDQTSRWQDLPIWEAYPEVQESIRKAKTSADEASSAAIPIADILRPMVERVFRVQASLERRFAVLRCAEAVRLYAANHEGKLPAALTDIKDVKVPVDPLTGKNFEYTVKDEGVVLYGPPFDKKDQPSQSNSIRVELQLRR